MGATTDPDDRRVTLSFDAWRHILEHEELVTTRSDILEIVNRPDHRLGGRAPGEEWFYRGGLGPSRWVKVVVHYEGDLGKIVTAFPRRALP